MSPIKLGKNRNFYAEMRKIQNTQKKRAEAHFSNGLTHNYRRQGVDQEVLQLLIVK